MYRLSDEIFWLRWNIAVADFCCLQTHCIQTILHKEIGKSIDADLDWLGYEAVVFIAGRCVSLERGIILSQSNVDELVGNYDKPVDFYHNQLELNAGVEGNLMHYRKMLGGLFYQSEGLLLNDSHLSEVEDENIPLKVNLVTEVPPIAKDLLTFGNPGPDYRASLHPKSSET